MTDGKAKFQAAGNKIKAEVVAKNEAEEREAQIALETIKVNPALVNMYQENALVGAENLSGQSPLLKVHTMGKSKNVLADGTKPNDGWFFYAPSQEQFETIDCHILTISRGFRAPGMEGSEKKEVFNQVMAGVITNDDKLKPFIMYVTGLKLQAMWDFGKEAAKFTRAVPVAIPMFALRIKLTTRQVDSKFGDVWVVDFEIVKDKKGCPEIVADEGQFQFLLDQVNNFQETIEKLILARSTEDQDEVPHPADIVGEAEEVFKAKAKPI